MILTRKDRRAASILAGHVPKRMSAALVRAARRKLVMLDAATELADLAAVPGNRLEALSGDRAGHYSIRINQQVRLVFAWNADVAGAEDVEIVDYH